MKPTAGLAVSAELHCILVFSLSLIPQLNLSELSRLFILCAYALICRHMLMLCCHAASLITTERSASIPFKVSTSACRPNSQLRDLQSDLSRRRLLGTQLCTLMLRTHSLPRSRPLLLHWIHFTLPPLRLTKMCPHQAPQLSFLRSTLPIGQSHPLDLLRL